MHRLSARVPRRRAVLADRIHDLAMPALLPFHVNRDDRVGRRHQEKNVKNQPENHAKHDQDQVENRRKRLPVQEQPERRQQGGENVDHRSISGDWPSGYQRCAGFRRFSGFRNSLYDIGVIQRCLLPRLSPFPSPN